MLQLSHRTMKASWLRLQFTSFSFPLQLNTWSDCLHQNSFSWQISRLTWFTRLDPVAPKQSVFSVQSSLGTSEVSGETKEHRRKGSLPPAVSLMSHCDRRCWACSSSSRLLIVSPSSAPVEVCPLLAVRDGEERGWRRGSRAAWRERVFSGGEAPPQARRRHQPHHLPVCGRLYRRLLGLTGRWQPWMDSWRVELGGCFQCYF